MAEPTPPHLLTHRPACAHRTHGGVCDCGVDLRMREVMAAFQDLAQWSRGLTYDQLLPHTSGDTDE